MHIKIVFHILHIMNMCNYVHTYIRTIITMPAGILIHCNNVPGMHMYRYVRMHTDCFVSCMVSNCHNNVIFLFHSNQSVDRSRRTVTVVIVHCCYGNIMLPCPVSM